MFIYLIALDLKLRLDEVWGTPAGEGGRVERIDEASAEGATTPETLRQKDRKSYETLESSSQV